MKRYFLFLTFFVIIVSVLVWYNFAPSVRSDFFQLLPPNAQAIFTLAEDASEQGVRSWLDEWFFLQKTPPVQRLFIRQLFPVRTTLVFYEGTAEKLQWLLIGDLGSRAGLVKALHFWWAKQTWQNMELAVSQKLLQGQQLTVYSFGPGSPSFFLYDNYLVACSNPAMQRLMLERLAAPDPRRVVFGQLNEADFFTTDSDRDGNFYLENRERFVKEQVSRYLPEQDPRGLEFFDQLKAVRGNFDLVDLNRLRFIFFFKFEKSYLGQANSLLLEWGERASASFAAFGMELEYLLKNHPEWDEVRLVFYPHKIGRYFAYLENAAAAQAIQAGSSFTDFKISETLLSQLNWSIQAAEASMDQKETTIECSTLTFKWFDKETLQASLSAKQGTLMREPLGLVARGEVRLRAGENLLETEELSWDSKRNLISSAARVKITRKKDIMTGLGLEATPDLENIRILRDVRISLKENPEELSSQ